MTDDIIYLNGGPRSPLPCARVETLLSEWVDGTLAPEMRAAVETHLDGCERCADVAADLAAIASEARTLPRLEPSRDLWAGIAERIEAPVVALDAHREATREVRLDPRRVTAAPPRRWWRTVAAAAALVVVTAGVTWRVTVEGARREARVAVRPDTGSRADSGTVAPAASTTLAGADIEPAIDSGSAIGAAPTRTVDAPRPVLATAPVRRRVATPVVAVEMPAAAQAYDREITAMRGIVAERRESLDPRTVRVLERNLKIIDEAIAESRAALAQDPASGLLAEQLTRAMRRKLELLRTAADLPARTT